MRASVGMGGPDDTARSVASGMDLGLDGKVALVTAASKGLGRGAASALAAEGASINSRDASACERRRRTSGPTCSRSPATSRTQASRRGSWTRPSSAGALHVLVANAGGPPKAKAIEVDDDTLRDAIEANLLSSSVSFAPLPHLRAAGWVSAPDRLEHGEAADAGPRDLEHGARRPVGVGEDGRARARGRGDHAEPRVPRAPSDGSGRPDRHEGPDGRPRRTSAASSRSCAPSRPASSRGGRRLGGRRGYLGLLRPDREADRP